MRYYNSSINVTQTPVNLNLTINSKNADKWKIYLESAGFDISSATNSIVRASRNNTALIVARHLVDVEID